MEPVQHGLASLKREDSLKKRYVYKLGANAIGLFANAATQMIVPRALGPAAYGSFSFLSAFFNQVVSFVDSGTSIGFYSKLSQRQHESGLIRFYWGFVSLVSLGVLLFVTGVLTTGLERWFWPDQEVRYIWMAVVWGLFFWYVEIINKIVDSYGFTVASEIARTQQQILGVGLIVLLFWLHRLSLTALFLYQNLMMVFLGLAWWRVLRREGLALFPVTRLTSVTIKGYIQEFYDYSAPLIVYAFVSVLAGMADRWLLQKFQGSAEQGFYGLSYQIGAIGFVFTKAMTPLLLREFSKSYANQDWDSIRVLFQRYLPMLYSIAAFFGVFVAVQAPKVAWIVGGHAYTGAIVAIAIMALYPIHQTYGQLSGSLFYATGQTRLYRNIGISVMLLGILVTFWMIAPERWFGLNLKATGLAIKMVGINVVSVNLLLWFNTRWLRLSFWKFLGHQFAVLALFAGIAWVVVTGTDGIIQSPVFAFLASGALYSLAGLGIVWFVPSIFAVSRTQLMDQWATISAYMGARRNHKGPSLF